MQSYRKKILVFFSLQMLAGLNCGGKIDIFSLVFNNFEFDRKKNKVVAWHIYMHET